MDRQLEMMEKRLQRLERSNRRFKLCCLLGIMCLSALGSLSAQQATKRTIEANEFVVRGPDGRIRATLFADSSEARLVFMNDSEKNRSVLAADRLVFADRNGNARIAIRPESDGGTLIINGPDGAGIELARQSDEVGLYMTHGNGDMLVASIEVNKKYGDLLQNGPSIRLSDGQGLRTTLGQAVIVGKPRTPVTSLVMMGKDGQIIWSAP